MKNEIELKEYLNTLEKDKIIELYLQEKFDHRFEIEQIFKKNTEEFLEYKNAYTSLLFKVSNFLDKKIRENKVERKFEKTKTKAGGVEGILPTRNDNGSAGYDFYVPYDVVIPYKGQVSIQLHIKAKMPSDEVLLIYMRSSMGIKNNLMLANGTGVIDSTYYNNKDNEGNIILCVYNYGTRDIYLNKGDRIAQGVFVKYGTTIDDKPLNEERVGGIGSSGV